MSLRYFTCDVFTDRRFGGNPLAVFPDAPALDDARMQAIARELNLSETVFVYPPDEPGNRCRLRIFTPAREVPFAGHPTIGTAFVLASIDAGDTADGEFDWVLEERVGPVPVRMARQGGRIRWGELTVAQPPEERAADVSAEQLADMLGLAPAALAGGEHAPVAASCGLPFTLVVLKDAADLGRLKVNNAAIVEALDGTWAPDLFVAAETGDGEWQARMFAPVDNLIEDPATGSAAAAFGAFLATRDTRADGRLAYSLSQGIEMGRPSAIGVSVDKRGGEIEAVRVRGASVMVSEARMQFQA